MGKETAEISEKFLQLRNYGWLVFGFADNKRLRKNASGFCDFVLIHGEKGVRFVEVKIGKDRYSEQQKALMQIIKRLSYVTKFINYNMITTSEEAINLIKLLLEEQNE